MKYGLAGFLVIFVLGTSFGQEMNIDVRSTVSRSIKKENLVKAKSLSELYVGFPSSWISDYESTEISTMTNKLTSKAPGVNDILSAEQITLLSSAEIGTEISIDVKFRERNAITHQMDISHLKYSITLVPETEAEYIGGNESLIQYLKENALVEIQKLPNNQLSQAIVKFTIDEQGDVSNIEMTTKSDSEIEQLLSEALNNMPLWKPATNSNGMKVQQDFILSIGNNLGC